MYSNKTAILFNRMVDYSDASLSRVFAALGDTTRRALLARLSRGDATVTELAEPFDVSLAAVSKHVRVLERAGLVRRTIVGREHRIALAPEPMRGVSNYGDQYRRYWEDRLAALERHLADKRAKRHR
jgi:DNA-binding transcriptional ArsR family regulator